MSELVMMSQDTEQNWNNGLKALREGKVIETTEDVYWHFLNCVPPLRQTGGAFLCSEPYKHTSKGEGVYYAGFRLDGRYFGKHLTNKEFSTWLKNLRNLISTK